MSNFDAATIGIIHICMSYIYYMYVLKQDKISHNQQLDFKRSG